MTTIKENSNNLQMPVVGFVSAVDKKDIYTAAEVQELQRELLQKQQQMEERMWADSTLSKFDDILRTNYDKSIEEFSDVVIYHVAKITNAMRGSFYTVGENYVEATGCYACTLSSLFKTKFELGEGLIGQSVKSKEILYLENLPQQNLAVSSSSGMLSATSVIVVPLSFNDKVYGVIELLFLTSLEFKYKDLLSRLSRNVATMLQSIQSNTKTKTLLNDSIFQAEALRSAEEELRQNMEEINTIRDDIEAKNRDLANQVSLTASMKKELEIRISIINKTTLVTEADLYGNITYVNEKFCEISKYRPDECIGKPHSILRHPDNPKELFKELWTTIKSGQIFQGTYKNRAKDGSTYWVEASIAPVFNENNEIVKYIGVRYDVTERIESGEQTKLLLEQAQQQSEELQAQEEELRQNLEELAATQEGVNRLNKDLEAFTVAAEHSMFVLEISPDAKLLRCNDRFLKETGYLAEELVNQDYSMLMSKEEFKNYQDTLSELKKGNIVKKLVKRIAKNKSEVILDATYYPIMNHNEQLVKVFKLSYNLTEYYNKIKTLETKVQTKR
jgi:PAS domain S-box-containing protein